MTDRPTAFEAELLRLGVPPARARRLAAETTQQAADSTASPGDVFGPAHLYARHLVAELGAPVAALGRTRGEPGPVMLSLAGVGKRYRRRTIFADVHLTVRGGEVAAIVGANGCGKSTLLRICAGLTRPSAGTIKRTRRVGFVPQDGGATGWLTADEHSTLFGAAAGMVPGRQRRAHQMSGGTRQKLNLVLGELHAPDLLLLDEPYQGFDQVAYVDFWQQVLGWRDAGRAVVVVTHLRHDLSGQSTRALTLGSAGPSRRPPVRGQRLPRGDDRQVMPFWSAREVGNYAVGGGVEVWRGLAHAGVTWLICVAGTLAIFRWRLRLVRYPEP